jgi:acetyl-CoA carboxylase carboxyltransferase component
MRVSLKSNWPQREALFEQLLAKQYDNGSASNMAATLEIDAVIDPAQTRHWLVRGLQTQRELPQANGLAIDAW